MSQVFENFQLAYSAIKANGLRTLMSVVGIAIGIAAVMTVGLVTQGGKSYIYTELNTYGLNSIWIYRNWQDDNPFGNVRQGSGITNEDYFAAKKLCCNSVIKVSPVVFETNWMKKIQFSNKFQKSSVEGVGEDYLSINNDQIIIGRNFRKNDLLERKRVAIIGEETRKKLFGNNKNVLGKKIRFDDTQLIIIGVLEVKNRDFLTAIGATQGYDENNRVLIPYTLYQQILGLHEIHTLRAVARSEQHVEQALKQITSLLERRHNNRYLYNTESMKGWISTTNSILSTISIVGSVGSIVALLIGGIGVFNIMSSAVLERTREIGIRKAIGATSNDVLIQFLMESVYISMIGGVLGLLLGFFVLIGISLLTGVILSPAWGFLLISLLVSFIVGLASGLFPARYAARLSPVDALRFD